MLFLNIIFFVSSVLADPPKDYFNSLGAIDILHQSIHLNFLDLGKSDVAALVDTEFLPLKAKKEVIIDFSSLGISSLNVESLDQDLNVISFNYEYCGNSNREILRIKFDHEIFPNDKIRKIRFTYSIDSSYFNGTKVQDVGGLYVGSLQNQYAGSTQEVLATAGWPIGARSWLPCNDHLEDLVLYDFYLETPKGLMAVANGILEKGSYLEGSSKNGERKVYHYEMKQPIKAYGVQIILGDFVASTEYFCLNDIGEEINCANDKEVKKIELSLFYPSFGTELERWQNSTHEMKKALIFYSKNLGQYPYDRAGIFTAPHGLQEYETLIGAMYPEVGVHEIVHHWWGDSVSVKNWGEVWLSEGITTYFQIHLENLDKPQELENSECLKVWGWLNYSPDSSPLDYYTDVYCSGAHAIYDLRKNMAAINLLDPISPLADNYFFRVFSKIYKKFQWKHLDSFEFINFLRFSAPQYFISPDDIKKLEQWENVVDEWQAKWIQV